MKKILLILILCIFLVSCKDINNDKNKETLKLEQYYIYNKELCLELSSPVKISNNIKIKVLINKIDCVILSKEINNKKVKMVCEMKNEFLNDQNEIEISIKDEETNLKYSGNISSNKEINVSNMEEYLKFHGRYYQSNYGYAMNYSASGVEILFYGTKLGVSMVIAGEGIFNVYLDNKFIERKKITTTIFNQDLVSDLEIGIHKLQLVKCNEYSQGRAYLKKVKTDGSIIKYQKENKLKIEVYGDSISCGFGILGNFEDSWDATKTYAYKFAEEYDADINFITYSGWGAYLSPYVSPKTDGAVTRLFAITDLNNNKKWDHSKFMADVVIVNLGTNDGWGIENANELKNFNETYKNFILEIDKTYNSPLIVCIIGVMTKTSNVNTSIENIVSSLNKENILLFRAYTMNNTTEAGYDGHPNYIAHERVYNELSTFLKEKMKKIMNKINKEL